MSDKKEQAPLPEVTFSTFVLSLASSALVHLGEVPNPVWGMIRLCIASVSQLAVVQMQDYLELGSEARMNFPGTLSDSNWTWRANDDIMSKDLAKKILKITKLYGRYCGK